MSETNNQSKNSEHYFEELSSLILRFIVDYKKIVQEKIYEDNRHINQPEKFFYTIIHKTLISLDASNFFIRNFDSSRDFQIPLCIILRAILNDIILVEGAIIVSKDETEMLINIERIYFDHVENLLNSLQSTEYIVRNWSEEQLQDEIGEFKKVFSKYFDEDGKAKLKSFQTSINPLVKRIFFTSNDKRSLELIKTAYFLYSKFSKLEHFGEFSFLLIHRVYQEEKQSDLQNELYNALRIIISALNNYAKVWDDLDIDFQHLKNLETEIVMMIPK